MREDPDNARAHDEKNLDAIIASLKAYGQRKPIVVRDGVIVAGNGTLRAARALGWTSISVAMADDLTPEQARAYAVADNRSAELASWSVDVLARTLAALPAEALPATGFADDGLAEALARGEDDGKAALEAILHGRPIPAPETEGDDDVPEPDAGPAVSQRGEVYALGPHRVMCGDSTNAEDVAALLAGARPGLLVTSPPYAQQRAYESGQGLGDWDALMQGVFGACGPHMAEDAQLLVNLGLVHKDREWQPYWSDWIEWMRGQGWLRFGWYVWDQGYGLPGDWNGRLAPSFEFVFHFTRKPTRASKTKECTSAGTSTVGATFLGKDGVAKPLTTAGAPINETRIPNSLIKAPRQTGGIEGHPAPYSVPFAEELVSPWPGSVYDPFLGSGTTLIAAARQGRVCYGMELEEKYVDVIRRRWTKWARANGSEPGSGALEP